jgi:hypothetical protein
MRNTLLEKLAKNKTFTIEDAEKISTVNKGVLKVILSRLEKQGQIERIEKGKYMIIPLGATKGKYTLNEFVLGGPPRRAMRHLILVRLKLPRPHRTNPTDGLSSNNRTKEKTRNHHLWSNIQNHPNKKRKTLWHR